MKTDASKLIKTIWLKRFTTFSESLGLYRDLLEDLGLGRADLLEAAKQRGAVEGLTRRDLLDLLSLEASFVRRENSPQAAEDFLNRVSELSDSRSYTLSFQSGLNALSIERRELALSRFNLAVRLAESEDDHLIASFNALTCLEDLGFDYGASLEQFSVDYESASYVVKTILDPHVLGMQLRVAFRRLDGSMLKALLVKRDVPEEFYYFAAFACEWHALLDESHQDLAKRFKSKLFGKDADAYQLSAEFATMSYRFDPKEDVAALSSDVIAERLYLWTWRWMLSADFGILTNIHSFLKSFKGNVRVGSVDDQLQMACAFAWLDYFGVNVESSLSGFQHSSAFVEGSFKRYSDELALVSRLRQARSGTNLALSDSSFEKTLHSSVLRMFLVEASASRATEYEADIFIDLQQQILRFKDGRSISDPQVVSALYLLANDGLVSYDDFCRTVFGFQNFVQERHTARLNNLIAKMNELLSSLGKVRRKVGHIYFERNSSLKMQCTSGLYEQALRLNTGVSKSSSKIVQSVLPNAQSELTYSRLDLQNVWDVSKSQALNNIETYLNEHSIQKFGVGKAVRYQVTNPSILKSHRS